VSIDVMEPIFGSDGVAIGWRRRDVVFDIDGKAVGFVFNRALYTRGGRYVGRFEDDLYRDAKGRVVAFEREATGGPLLPVITPPPVQPPPELRPPVPQFEAAPRPGMRSMTWSEHDLIGLLEVEPARR
jgi:hypothetical protein